MWLTAQAPLHMDGFFASRKSQGSVVKSKRRISLQITPALGSCFEPKLAPPPHLIKVV
jgi:hypothetical protein